MGDTGGSYKVDENSTILETCKCGVGAVRGYMRVQPTTVGTGCDDADGSVYQPCVCLKGAAAAAGGSPLVHGGAWGSYLLIIPAVIVTLLVIAGAIALVVMGRSKTKTLGNDSPA